MAYDGCKTYWLEPTGRVRRSFRCFVDGCSKGSYCNAELPLDIIPAELVTDRDTGGKAIQAGYSAADWPAERFPTTCDACGQEMKEPTRQISTERLYRRGDTGEEIGLRGAPPGALWDAEWMRGSDGEDHGFTGPDGLSVCAICPDGTHWTIDSEASNCTATQYVPSADDPRARRFKRTHWCWKRTGDPKTGNITVSKGEGCTAGGGSIQTDKYHGMLQNGAFSSG